MAKKICDDIRKGETFNPGNPSEDRMALEMIEDAECDGRVREGGCP